MPRHNHKNNESLIIQYQNEENHKNNSAPGSQEIRKKLIIERQNHENHDLFKSHSQN